MVNCRWFTISGFTARGRFISHDLHFGVWPGLTSPASSCRCWEAACNARSEERSWCLSAASVQLTRDGGPTKRKFGDWDMIRYDKYTFSLFRIDSDIRDWTHNDAKLLDTICDNHDIIWCFWMKLWKRWWYSTHKSTIGTPPQLIRSHLHVLLQQSQFNGPRIVSNPIGKYWQYEE